MSCRSSASSASMGVLISISSEAVEVLPSIFVIVARNQTVSTGFLIAILNHAAICHIRTIWDGSVWLMNWLLHRARVTGDSRPLAFLLGADRKGFRRSQSECLGIFPRGREQQRQQDIREALGIWHPAAVWALLILRREGKVEVAPDIGRNSRYFRYRAKAEAEQRG